MPCRVAAVSRKTKAADYDREPGRYGEAGRAKKESSSVIVGMSGRSHRVDRQDCAHRRVAGHGGAVHRVSGLENPGLKMSLEASEGIPGSAFPFRQHTEHGQGGRFGCGRAPVLRRWPLVPAENAAQTARCAPENPQPPIGAGNGQREARSPPGRGDATGLDRFRKKTEERPGAYAATRNHRIPKDGKGPAASTVGIPGGTKKRRPLTVWVEASSAPPSESVSASHRYPR